MKYQGTFSMIDEIIEEYCPSAAIELF